MKQDIEMAIRANRQIHILRKNNDLTIVNGDKYSEKIDFCNQLLCQAMGWSYDA